MKKLFLLTIAWAFLLVPIVAAQSSLQPEGWDSQIKLREAADINPDPHVVEVNLEAGIVRVQYEPGRFVDAWTYNGDVPGPLIRARVGDRLIVHFRNNLPQPTTVHWHGIRLPIQMDGVPGHSQPEVQPGRSFTYDFIVPDAGLFWYHPHVESAMQVGYGLYGAVLVEDPGEQVGISDELIIVLSDIAIEDNGTLQAPDSAGTARLMFGLEGNHVLVNGRTRPKLLARDGAPQRWRIVNTAKTRYFELDFAEAPAGTRPFTVIGSDGGLQEYPTEHDTLVIAPGERKDVIVTPHGLPASEILVRSLPYNRGYGSEYELVEDLFTIGFANLASYTADIKPRVRRTIEPIDQTGATPVNVDITLVQLDPHTIEYRINDVRPEHMKSFKGTVGETQIWSMTNHTKWSHPIHLHGFFFQAVDKNGEPIHPLAWKDTIDAPYEGTVRFIVKYDDRPGMWMFHCHVLDHAEGGVMGMLELGRTEGAHHDSTTGH